MTDRHPDDPTLADFVFGALAPEAADRIEAAAALDEALAGRIARLRTIVDLLRTDDWALPPAAARRRVLGLFRQQTRGPAPTGWLAAARTVVARLVFDGRAEPALAGFRGLADDGHLTWDSDLGRVDLRIAPGARAGAAWRLRGQIASVAEATMVSLRPHGSVDPCARSTVDAHGRFRLDATAGAYDLVIEFTKEDVALLLANVAVGDA
jgi:hypothetical protein